MDVDKDTTEGVDLAWDVCTDLEGRAGTQVLVEQRAPTDDEKTAGTTLFVASTDDEDRALDVVKQDWRLRNYRRNPVILDNHNPYRVVGQAVEATVPRPGEDAGRLMIRARWDLQSRDPSIAIVGDQHLNGFRRAGSVGFRHGKKTERSKLPDGSPYRRDPIKIETPWGSYERSGYLYEQNELLEHSSATIPMNPEALQRALAVGDPGAQMAQRLEELDPADIVGRAKLIGQSVRRTLAADFLAALDDLVADDTTRAAVLDLLIPGLKHRMRTDPEIRRIVQAYSDARPAPTPTRTPRGDGLDWLFSDAHTED